MKIKDKIRHKVSQTLDVLIPANRWEQYIDLIDRDGKFTKKNMLAIAMISCQQIELMESLIEDLYYQISLLENPANTNTPTTTHDNFKLRTAIDVTTDVEAQLTPDTKAFYISNGDWQIMERAMDKELAKTKPEYGYGKEIDPKDGKEKTCLYYKDLPVFRNLH